MNLTARKRLTVITNGRRHRPDYWLIILPSILIGIGLVVVYAISPALGAQTGSSGSYYVSKQLIAVFTAVVAFIISAHIPIRIWRRLQTPLLVSATGLAIAVRLFGEQVNGAYRWIQIGGFSFQAAELIKFALLIWIAGFLVERLQRGQLTDSAETIKPLFIVIGLVGLVVAKLESDLGSAGVIVTMLLAMVFMAGLPLKRLALIGTVVLVGATLAIASSGYRRQRLATFLKPTRDCQTSGYQSCQALIAVGSGGLSGLGLARSVQAFGYLPEAANDSIFAIIAEKFGFIGTTLLLGLFVAFFTRCKRLIERAPDNYSRLLATGILAWLSAQAIINMGAMLGLVPLKGITLPFISYGGTSLLFVAAAAGLLFQLSRFSSYEAVLKAGAEGKRSNDNFAERRGFRGAYHPTPSSRV